LRLLRYAQPPAVHRSIDPCRAPSTLALALIAAAHSAAQPPKKADVKTTAAKLAKEFIDDEKAAEKRYKGKVIEVEGVVSSVNAAGGGGTLVTLRGAKKAEKDLFGTDVACGVPGKGAAAALKLKEGDRVTYRGNLLFGSASRVNLGDGDIVPGKKGGK
jgi:hypothetical protein